MALTPSIQTSQSDVTVVTAGVTGNTQVAQSDVAVVFNLPSLGVEVSYADLSYIMNAAGDIQLSQMDVIVVYRGRVADPRVIAWTFTLDGHDFYVLRLGMVETLVYDTLSQQWYVWGSETSDLWRAYSGINWRGAQRWARQFGSDVIVGDDGNGALYLLNPDADTDDDATSGDERQLPFQREFVAQYVMSGGYDFEPCYGIQVFGSIGQTDATQEVTLEVSDNRGQSYVTAGVREAVPDSFDFRLQWQSLGSMRAPGRLFKVTDYGALHRVDAVEMFVQDGSDG